MKQTAVEWLIDELRNKHGMPIDLYSEFEQALEMEKEQMVQSYANGQADSLSLVKNMKDIPPDFNQIISDNFNDLI